MWAVNAISRICFCISAGRVFQWLTPLRPSPSSGAVSRTTGGSGRALHGCCTGAVTTPRLTGMSSTIRGLSRTPGAGADAAAELGAAASSRRILTPAISCSAGKPGACSNGSGSASGVEPRGVGCRVAGSAIGALAAGVPCTLLGAVSNSIQARLSSRATRAARASHFHRCSVHLRDCTLPNSGCESMCGISPRLRWLSECLRALRMYDMDSLPRRLCGRQLWNVSIGQTAELDQGLRSDHGIGHQLVMMLEGQDLQLQFLIVVLAAGCRGSTPLQ